jgi:phosphoribosylanthranilate isomerase
MKIKICGLSRLEDIEAVNQALPDYIGFVFAESRRRLDGETAKVLKAALSPEIKAVGVFVNNSVDEIVALAEKETIDLIQLHGDEDEKMIAELKKAVHLPIIKAMRIHDASDIKKTNADYRLFDTYDASQYGGSGECFNWNLIADVKENFFLAGGLNIDNIEEAINRVNPFGVDISSGVETDGKKDRGKIIKIVEKIRRMNR